MEKFRFQRVAVTGGAGFIGSHLVDHLVSLGCEVTVIDNFSSGDRKNLEQHKNNPKVRVFEGDVRNLKLVEKAFTGIDLVFHLATHCVRLSLTDPLTNHDVNATGTLNALIAASALGVSRFVYCSSSEVYGNAAVASGLTLLNEDAFKRPSTVYGASKLVGEQYTRAFFETKGLSSMTVRPFNAYGERSHLLGAYGEVIPRFAVLIQSGRSPVIFGDGTQTRDFTYVKDIAKGLVLASQTDSLVGESVNVACGKEVSINELGETLCQVLKLSFQPRYTKERPGDILRLPADNALARHLWPDFSFTPLSEGLSRYVNWINSGRPDYQALANLLFERNWDLRETTKIAA
ncbi:MAG: SDR family NAD(P)-dependent oxidoreductase [Deltaproteobacteria bacterium]|nr:SDR family NAD(P)-dependent oxidoreductase [Deltaproteobacteria bacterium]MBI3293265.1 SDR family NAD(P)-dependent oxidoreductase [Deltaproteobacteria bacterium]